MFISKNYANKRWTNLEGRTPRRALSSKTGNMFCRRDSTTLKYPVFYRQ